MQSHLGQDTSNDNPVYNGIVFKKRIMGKSKTKIRNGVLLSPKIVFGNSQNILQRPIFVLNGNELVYLAGNNLIIHNTKNSQQSFIFKSTQKREIMALNYTNENQQSKIAIALAGNSRINPAVEIYYHKSFKIQTLHHKELPPLSQITHLAFMKDDNFLITFSSNQTLKKGYFCIWNVEKQQLICFQEGPISIDFMETNHQIKKGVFYLNQGKLRTIQLKLSTSSFTDNEFRFQNLERMSHQDTDLQEEKTDSNIIQLQHIDLFCYNDKSEFLFLISGKKFQLFLNT